MLEGIFLMGILQGVVLIGIVCSKSRLKTHSSQFICILIGITTLLIFGQLLINTTLYKDWPILFIFITGLPLLIGPYLYFYIAAKLKKWKKQWEIILHHIPFIVYQIIMVVFIQEEYAGDVRQFIMDSVIGYDANQVGSAISIGHIKSFHLLIYTIISAILLFKNDRSKVKGLYQVVVVFAVSQTIFWIFIFIQNPMADEIFILFQIIFLYLIGYQSILNKEAILEKARYETSRLGSNEVDSILIQIREKIEADRLYQNQDFSLKDLSERMDFNEHQISQVINQVTGDNFSVLINNYRVEKVKEMMRSNDYDHLKLLSIAFEAGFSNKNSFNQHFRRVTGMTPSAFKKDMSQES